MPYLVTAPRWLINMTRYLPDMNASAMTVVAEKAPLIQREALMEYFYGHIYPGPSVDVSVNVSCH